MLEIIGGECAWMPSPTDLTKWRTRSEETGASACAAILLDRDLNLGTHDLDFVGDKNTWETPTFEVFEG